MRYAFKIFFVDNGFRSTIVLICLVGGAFLELLGLGAILPLFESVSATSATSDTELGRIASSTLYAVGLEPNLAILTGFVVAMLLLKNVGLFFALTYAGFARAAVVTEIRQKLLTSVLKAHWHYLITRNTGRITTDLSYNAHQAGDAYLASAHFFAYFVQAVFYLVGALLVSVDLTLAGLAAGLCATLLFGRLIRLSREAGTVLTRTISEMVTDLTNILNNIKPIKAMNREDSLLALLQKRAEIVRRSIQREEIYRNAMERGVDMFMTVLIGVGFFVTATYMKIAMAELLVMGILAIRGTNTLKVIQTKLRSVGEFEAGYLSSTRLLSTLSEQEEHLGGHVVPTFKDGCRFEKVGFAYGDLTVIREADFTINANRITVILGLSGAGKTSLIDLLLGLHSPTSGTIRIDGAPLEDISLRDWRRMIGYVPQELTLMHGTIRENLTLSDASISDAKVYNALRLAGAGRFVLGLPDKIDTNIGEMGARLSGGERQRIALARALVVRPKILILDEVTSALDPVTEAEICNNVASLRDQYTVVAITHRPAWEQIADTLLEVDQGRVTERLPRNSLRSSAV